MIRKLGRRDFLTGSAALAGLAAADSFMCVELASAVPIDVPVVDKLSIRVLVDSTHNLFLRPNTVNGVSVQPTPVSAGFPNVIHTQWGLSLWLESQRGNEPRTLLLDYGYTPDVLINNMGIMGVDGEEDRRPDRQPRPFRPLRRPDGIPRQVPQCAAGRREAVRRRGGQFLPSTHRAARPIDRLRHPRPARPRGAEG